MSSEEKHGLLNKLKKPFKHSRTPSASDETIDHHNSIVESAYVEGQKRAESETGKKVKKYGFLLSKSSEKSASSSPQKTHLAANDYNEQNVLVGAGTAAATGTAIGGTSHHGRVISESSVGKVLTAPPTVNRKPVAKDPGGDFANEKKPLELVNDNDNNDGINEADVINRGKGDQLDTIKGSNANTGTFDNTKQNSRGYTENTNPAYANDAIPTQGHGYFFDPKDTQGGVYGHGGNDHSEATRAQLSKNRNLKTMPTAYKEQEEREAREEALMKEIYDAGHSKGYKDSEKEEAQKDNQDLQQIQSGESEQPQDPTQVHSNNKSVYNSAGIAAAVQEAKGKPIQSKNTQTNTAQTNSSKSAQSSESAQSAQYGSGSAQSGQYGTSSGSSGTKQAAPEFTSGTAAGKNNLNTVAAAGAAGAAAGAAALGVHEHNKKNSEYDSETAPLAAKNTYSDKNTATAPNTGNSTKEVAPAAFATSSTKTPLDAGAPPSSSQFDYDHEIAELDKKIDATQQEIDQLHTKNRADPEASTTALYREPIGENDSYGARGAALGGGLAAAAAAAAGYVGLSKSNAPVDDAYDEGVKKAAYDEGQKQGGSNQGGSYSTLDPSSPQSKRSGGVFSGATAAFASNTLGFDSNSTMDDYEVVDKKDATEPTVDDDLLGGTGTTEKPGALDGAKGAALAAGAVAGSALGYNATKSKDKSTTAGTDYDSALTKDSEYTKTANKNIDFDRPQRPVAESTADSTTSKTSTSSGLLDSAKLAVASTAAAAAGAFGYEGYNATRNDPSYHAGVVQEAYEAGQAKAHHEKTSVDEAYLAGSKKHEGETANTGSGSGTGALGGALGGAAAALGYGAVKDRDTEKPETDKNLNTQDSNLTGSNLNKHDSSLTDSTKNSTAGGVNTNKKLDRTALSVTSSLSSLASLADTDKAAAVAAATTTKPKKTKSKNKILGLFKSKDQDPAKVQGSKKDTVPREDLAKRETKPKDKGLAGAAAGAGAAALGYAGYKKAEGVPRDSLVEEAAQNHEDVAEQPRHQGKSLKEDLDSSANDGDDGVQEIPGLGHDTGAADDDKKTNTATNTEAEVVAHNKKLGIKNDNRDLIEVAEDNDPSLKKLDRHHGVGVGEEEEEEDAGDGVQDIHNMNSDYSHLDKNKETDDISRKETNQSSNSASKYGLGAAAAGILGAVGYKASRQDTNTSSVYSDDKTRTEPTEPAKSTGSTKSDLQSGTTRSAEPTHAARGIHSTEPTTNTTDTTDTTQATDGSKSNKGLLAAGAGALGLGAASKNKNSSKNVGVLSKEDEKTFYNAGAERAAYDHSNTSTRSAAYNEGTAAGTERAAYDEGATAGKKSKTSDLGVGAGAVGATGAALGTGAYADSKKDTTSKKEEPGLTIEVIGINDRKTAAKVADKALKDLAKQGVDMSSGKLIVNAETKEVYKVEPSKSGAATGAGVAGATGSTGRSATGSTDSTGRTATGATGAGSYDKSSKDDSLEDDSNTGLNAKSGAVAGALGAVGAGLGVAGLKGRKDEKVITTDQIPPHHELEGDTNPNLYHKEHERAKEQLEQAAHEGTLGNTSERMAKSSSLPESSTNTTGKLLDPYGGPSTYGGAGVSSGAREAYEGEQGGNIPVTIQGNVNTKEAETIAYDTVEKLKASPETLASVKSLRIDATTGKVYNEKGEQVHIPGDDDSEGLSSQKSPLSPSLGMGAAAGAAGGGGIAGLGGKSPDYNYHSNNLDQVDEYGLSQTDHATPRSASGNNQVSIDIVGAPREMQDKIANDQLTYLKTHPNLIPLNISKVIYDAQTGIYTDGMGREIKGLSSATSESTDVKMPGSFIW